jgi:hypothetical protein
LLPRARAECSGAQACSCPECPVIRSHWDRNWFVVETASFQVRCESSSQPAEHLARHAESLRKTLQAKWLNESASVDWTPRCQVLLYDSQQNYVAAVGRGSERTVGSSLVEESKGKVLSRRIDLVGGKAAFLSAALPHELTHVVVKDRFATSKLPHWADEGMAILADPDAKQRRHQSDLLQAHSHRAAFHTAELLALGTYPPSHRFGAFYGQCASLTGYLVGLKGPAVFVDFVERADRFGYDSALHECYGIANIGELDRHWYRAVSSLGASGQAALSRAKAPILLNSSTRPARPPVSHQ